MWRTDKQTERQICRGYYSGLHCEQWMQTCCKNDSWKAQPTLGLCKASIKILHLQLLSCLRTALQPPTMSVHMIDRHSDKLKMSTVILATDNVTGRCRPTMMINSRRQQKSKQLKEYSLLYHVSIVWRWKKMAGLLANNVSIPLTHVGQQSNVKITIDIIDRHWRTTVKKMKSIFACNMTYQLHNQAVVRPSLSADPAAEM